jgi:hypothetical protein
MTQLLARLVVRTLLENRLARSRNVFFFMIAARTNDDDRQGSSFFCCFFSSVSTWFGSNDLSLLVRLPSPHPSYAWPLLGVRRCDCSSHLLVFSGSMPRRALLGVCSWYRSRKLRQGQKAFDGPGQHVVVRVVIRPSDMQQQPDSSDGTRRWHR